jgi:hypothetical protein
VQGPQRPPAEFQVSLVPVERASEPPLCAGSNADCSPAPVATPVRERPFVYLGRARPLFTERELDRIPIPQYRLRFRVPEARPGAYAFVIDGGGVGDPVVDTSGGLLRVRSEQAPIASGGDGGASAAIWWFGGAVALGGLALGGLLIRLRRAG